MFVSQLLYDLICNNLDSRLYHGCTVIGPWLSRVTNINLSRYQRGCNVLQSPMTCCLLGNVYLSLLFITCISTVTLCLFFLSLFFPYFFSLFACSLHFFLHILVTKENMNTPELNIQESVISSMTPCKGTQILLFFFFFSPFFP